VKLYAKKPNTIPLVLCEISFEDHGGAVTGRWLALLAGAGALISHLGATTFLSISADPGNGYVPDLFSSLSDSGGSLSTIGSLGGGSLGFNGGLTAGPGGVLYAIANDSSGNGSFYSVQLNGSATLIGSAGGLGTGFLGGLAYDSSNSTFYAAMLDGLGNTSLDSITGGGAAAATGLPLGTGFSGLAYDSANGLFYGIGHDGTGFSTLYSFGLGGPVNTVGGLGYGFGALTYDPIGGQLWAIDPINNFSSQLFSLTTEGLVSAPYYTIGDGFVELAAAPVPTPEPGILLCLGVGWALAVLYRKKVRQEERR
jgi:hypothetical protein